MRLAEDEPLAPGKVLRYLGLGILDVTEDASVCRATRAASGNAALVGVLHAEGALLDHALGTYRRVDETPVLAVILRISPTIFAVDAVMEAPLFDVALSTEKKPTIPEAIEPE